MSKDQEPTTKASVTYTEDQLREIMDKAVNTVKSATHKWRQRGAYLVCTSCEHEHGLYIGTTLKVTGIREDGTPILIKV